MGARRTAYQARVEDDLAEWDYGEYEGRPTSEIRKERPDWSIWRATCATEIQASAAATTAQRGRTWMITRVLAP